MQKEEKPAERAKKEKTAPLPPPPPLAQGLDPPLSEAMSIPDLFIWESPPGEARQESEREKFFLKHFLAQSPLKMV